jgi:hypothetical protein
MKRVPNIEYTAQCDRINAFVLITARRESPLWLPRELRRYISERYVFDRGVEKFINRPLTLLEAIAETPNRVYKISFDKNASSREIEAVSANTWPVLDVTFITLVLFIGFVPFVVMLTVLLRVSNTK